MRSILTRGVGLLVIAGAAIVGSVGGLPDSNAAVDGSGLRTGSIPNVEVAIDARAREGQFRTVEGSFRLRCRPGLSDSQVLVSLSQDGITSPEQYATSVPCGGAWHRQGFRSVEGFRPGPVVVHVRVVLVDAVSGAPRGTVTASKEVFARPGAVLRLPASAELRPRGVLRLAVLARCDSPWVLAEWHLSATQSRGRAHASTQLDLPCDGSFYRRVVRLRATGVPFEPGWVRLDSFLHTLDPVNRDPAPGAVAARGVRVP